MDLEVLPVSFPEKQRPRLTLHWLAVAASTARRRQTRGAGTRRIKIAKQDGQVMAFVVLHAK
jgi:DUF971 family protein